MLDERLWSGILSVGSLPTVATTCSVSVSSQVPVYVYLEDLTESTLRAIIVTEVPRSKK